MLKRKVDSKVIFIQVTGKPLSSSEKGQLNKLLSKMNLGLTFVFIDERWKVISEEKAIQLFEQMAADIRTARGEEPEVVDLERT